MFRGVAVTLLTLITSIANSMSTFHHTALGAHVGYKAGTSRRDLFVG